MSSGLETRPGATTIDLEDLVELAWSGRIRVPHFQRDFRWTRTDVIRLFDSIVKRYPVGSLLLWQRPAPAQRVPWGHCRSTRLPWTRRTGWSMASSALSASAGITVPPVRLVHRDELDGLPPNVWPSREEWAYAVRRFDRTDDREPVHIEDLAQVRNVYPDYKYRGNYETVAALVYRGRDIAALREFARRLAFTVLISNGDAHLKNWSLIYPDGRIPRLAPAYDLVSTAFYLGNDEQLGLKFGGTPASERCPAGLGRQPAAPPG